MWRRRFLWLDTAGPCSAEGDEDILVDGRAYGEVRSKTGQIRLFHEGEEGFVSVGSCGRRYRAFRGPGSHATTSKRPEDHTNGRTAA